MMTHAGELFVATPSQKSKLAQPPKPFTRQNSDKFKTQVATKMVSEYELPTLLLTSGFVLASEMVLVR